MWKRAVVCIAFLFQNTLAKFQVLLLEGASPQSSPGVGKGRFLLCCFVVVLSCVLK